MRPYVEELAAAPDPVTCCELLEGLPYRIFLDSAAQLSLLGRYSFLCADPVAVVRSRAGATERRGFDGTWHTTAADPLDEIRALMGPYMTAPVPELPPFQGGAAGFLSYDWGRRFEQVDAHRHDDLGVPDLVLGIYDWVLAWDHSTSRSWLISTGLPATSENARASAAEARARAIRQRLSRPARLAGAHSQPPHKPEWSSAPSHPIDDREWPADIHLRSTFSRSQYLTAVDRVRNYITAGDIFQANLSQRLSATLNEPPWALYRRLRRQNAAPFAAYMDFDDVLVLSASPERFLRADPDGTVETRPIKGTRPRGIGPEHDAALGQALSESAKDRAENLMIVDLMRNDLSKVCVPGSVRVRELFAVEHYATVHHLVSTVTGQLAANRDPLDLIRGSFPGGSITGAPKIRAMQVIAELEPTARGIYCGAIGYWSLTGHFDTNIAIRTLVARDGAVYFGAGGGVVIDSDPADEYRETMHKARGIINAIAVEL